MSAAALRLVRPLESCACLVCGSNSSTALLSSPAQMDLTHDSYRFVRCNDCGLVRLDPRVPAEEIGAFYDATYLPHRGPSAWGRYAPLVERAQAATDRARLRKVQSAVQLTERSRVLDVGCGKPTFLRALRDRTGAHAVGLDFADEAWKAEPQRWRDLELHPGTLASAHVSGRFDAITMWHALEHEYDPLDTLRRLHALAAPGAALVVEVPDFDSLTRRLHGAHWAGFHTPRHTAAYTAATLRRLLDTAGWTVERQQRFGTLDPYVLWWLGEQERTGRSVRGSLEERFVPFVLGRIALTPVTLLQRWIPLGIQTAVARA